MTEAQYRQVIADLFGSDITVGGRFDPLSRTEGLIAIGASAAAITPSGFEQYDARARSIAAQVVDPAHRDVLIECQPKDAKTADDNCARQFLGRTGRLIFRRALAEPEQKALVAIASKSADTLGDFYGGLAFALAGLLASPEFLFVSDATEPDPAKAGQVRLSGYGKAARLSFLLWNSTPDDALLTAAEKGDLDDKSKLARQVDRMLTSPRLKAGVRAFFTDMLAFDTFDAFQKDQVLYPAVTPEVARDAAEQTLRTIEQLLVVEKGDYRDLFTTRKTFLSGPLGLIYQVPVANPQGWTAYEFPKDDPRAGLLSQISFVALHAHPGRSSPTLRGRAVREILMCQRVPDPPGNVNFQIVQDTSNPNFRTTRQRLDAHRTDPTCAGCHKITDPIGLALENFDGAGQFRTTENGAPIDTADEFDGKHIANATDLGQVLHDDPSVTSCLVHRLYEYATQHRTQADEAAFVEYLKERFVAGGYRVPDLLRQIATSDAFYRVNPAAANGADPQTADAVGQGAKS